MGREKVLKELLISEDISAEMSVQSSLFARVGFIWTRAQDMYERTKSQLKDVEADLDSSLRKKFIQRGERLTDKAIELATHRHSDWRDARLRLTVASLRAARAQVVMDAFRMRSSMLMGLGALQRAEREQETFSGTRNESTRGKRRKFNELLEQKIVGMGDSE